VLTRARMSRVVVNPSSGLSLIGVVVASARFGIDFQGLRSVKTFPRSRINNSIVSIRLTTELGFNARRVFGGNYVGVQNAFYSNAGSIISRIEAEIDHRAFLIGH
jgi:hypothetical protein